MPALILFVSGVGVGIGTVREMQTKFINALYDADTASKKTVITLNPDKARFIVNSFRKKEGYVDKSCEGELRELVELRVPPAVLNKLIKEDKVKEKGGMIFFPKLVVGSKDLFGKEEIGNRPKEIGVDVSIELESGIAMMEELIASGPLKACGELGYSSDCVGDALAPAPRLSLEVGMLDKR